MHNLTRRGLIAAAAASGVAASMPTHAAAAPREKRRVDVMVIGAGFAGLVAARTRIRAARSVAVVEARDRIGGRALNLQLAGGEVTERGATFAGPTQDHILNLARELGDDTFLTGNNRLPQPGHAAHVPERGPTGTAPPDPTILAEMTAAVTLLDQVSTEVPVDAPWTAAQGARAWS